MAAAAAAAAPEPPGPAEAPAAAPALKSRFRTREGSYRLLGPAAAAAAAPPGPAALPPVRLSVVRLARSRSPPGGAAERSRVCCNLGRELHFYGGDGSGGRGNRRFTAGAETLALLVGFSAGQVQCLDLAKKDSAGRLFNEEEPLEIPHGTTTTSLGPPGISWGHQEPLEIPHGTTTNPSSSPTPHHHHHPFNPFLTTTTPQRLIDRSKVTRVKWLPDTERLFLASHASGHLYLYDAAQPSGAGSPRYSLLTQGEGFRVFSCRSKTPRNPLLKWAVGSGPLNEFAFSPDGRSLACVSQDGVLRVFHFSSMLLQGMMRSYFGGLLCVCWSPDGRYVVTGGEDDLVTVWSFAEGRVVARGRGHKSWVNAVAFDPFAPPDGAREPPSVAYRFGSAGQDTQFCLWDLTEEVLELRSAHPRLRPAAPGDPPPVVVVPALPRSLSRSNSLPQPAGGPQMSPRVPPVMSTGRFSTLTPREPRGGGAGKEQKRYHSLGSINRAEKTAPGVGAGAARGSLDMGKVLGTALCPRLHEVPLLEPLVCKKIAQERLTVLLFLEDCIVTACQEGLICTWARPGVS
ncbi:Dystrophia myotonica WD repeat-containing protein, partial [Lonchura striata]